jgi:hypothetical protein
MDMNNITVVFEGYVLNQILVPFKQEVHVLLLLCKQKKVVHALLAVPPDHVAAGFSHILSLADDKVRFLSA